MDLSLLEGILHFKKWNRNFADQVMLNINRMHNFQTSLMFRFYLKMSKRNWKNMDSDLTQTLFPVSMMNFHSPLHLKFLILARPRARILPSEGGIRQQGMRRQELSVLYLLFWWPETQRRPSSFTISAFKHKTQGYRITLAGILFSKIILKSNWHP